MSEQDGYSPSFKRPAAILRIRRKRARSEGVGSSNRGFVSSPGLSVPGVRPFSPGPLLSGLSRSIKRRNPFASIENTCGSPKKRPNNVVYSEGEDDSLGCEPFGEGKDHTNGETRSVKGQTLQFSERLLHDEKSILDAPKKPVSLHEVDYLYEDDSLLEERTRSPTLTITQSSDSSSVSGHPAVCVEYPADWSLKTRLLFTSPHTFSWAEHLKAQEEAVGLTQHCRAAHASLPPNIEDPRRCSELRSAFQQCLGYWQHPSFPWLPLFPRIGSERKFSGKNTPWAQDEALQQSLLSDWTLSVSSLYSLLRSKLCPYFYLCTYQFTVLFRSSGLSGTKGITALLSPTTRGLREAMRAEGIDFTLPLLEEKRKSRDDSQNPVEDEQDGTEGGERNETEEDEDDDGGFSWLKEMGVQDKIKKPDSISIKLRKEQTEVRLDHRPESVVLVEGSNTFSLLNFLINCKSLVAASGTQAGLPPTLLAPVAFRGATLHTLKARSLNVKTQVRTGYQDVCSLEVTGPVMPHALHALTQLFGPSQQGHFSVGLYTHEPTAVLNTPVAPTTRTSQDSVLQDLRECGLAVNTIQQLVEPTVLGKSALRLLNMREFSYSWRF